MMVSFRYISLIVAVCLLGAALPAQAQEAPRIATANPSRIFDELRETQDFRQFIDSQMQDLEQRGRELEGRVQSLRAARDQLRPGTAQYQERHREFEQAAIELRVLVETRQAELQRAQKRKMQELFDKINRGVAEIAQQRNIDLVIAEQPRPQLPPDLDEVPMEQLIASMTQRNLLYAAGPIDITNEVIALLDAQYQEN